MQPDVFFLPVAARHTEGPGQRLCIYYPAQHDGVACAPLGLVLYIHPFAEEMNKSRRMAALQSRALAQAGFAVLQIDLLGCGDSSGDFGDATWERWVNDVVAGSQWLRDKHPADASKGRAPVWLWGLRVGCLLAVDAAKQMDEPCNFIFWQPPASGKPLLQQFLRLKVAGDMLTGQSKGVMEGMRQQLAGGSPVEIAGYMLAPGLAFGLEQAALVPPAVSDPAPRVEWFELSTREDASLSPISAKTVQAWEQAGCRVNSHLVNGPAFWQTTEIEDAPLLIDATTAALGSATP
jgi:exosortase A-associated hydrolase 2